MKNADLTNVFFNLFSTNFQPNQSFYKNDLSYIIIIYNYYILEEQ